MPGLTLIIKTWDWKRKLTWEDSYLEVTGSTAYRHIILDFYLQNMSYSVSSYLSQKLFLTPVIQNDYSS